MERSTQQQKMHSLQNNVHLQKRSETLHRTPDNSRVLHTPGIEEDSYLQLSVTPTSLYLSFDMEESLNSSKSEVLVEGLVEHEIPTNDSSSVDDITSFVDMLKSSSDKIKFEAASALLHVLSINHANTVVECGAVPLLLESLGSPKQSVRDECAKCLGKIAGFSPQLRDHVINQGGLSRLLQHLEYSSDDLSLDTLLEATSQFFNDKLRPHNDLIKSLFPKILGLLSPGKEASIIIAACKIISYLAEDCPSTAQMFLEAGAKKKLMQLLTHRDETVVAISLRAIRYLVPPKSTGARDFTDTAPTAPYLTPTWGPERKAAPKMWLLSPLLGDASHGVDIGGLREIDVLTCQNVEMFKSSDIDERHCGAFFTGQIGLRCIHCGRSPFATIQFSTVFPASIDHLGASLMHVSKHHLSNCPSTPPQIRCRISQLLRCISSEDPSSSLEFFCRDLCERFGVVSHYPPKSGLSLREEDVLIDKIDDYRPNSASSRSKDYNLGKVLPEIENISAHPRRQYSPEENVNYFPSRTSSPENIWRNHPETVRSIPSHECSKQKVVFEQKSHGVWKCKMCRYNPSGGSTSIWKGHHPPPRAFIESHAKECPGRYDAHDCDTTAYSSVNQDVTQTHLDDSHRSNRSSRAVKNASRKSPVGEQKNLIEYPLAKKKDGSIELVMPEDKKMLSDLTIFVLGQLEVCYFTGTSATKPKGFPGLACIHCGDKKGGRKFFWSCPERFKNNSSTFTKHMEECKFAPDSVKQKLQHYKTYHAHQMSRLPRGTLTQFFKRMFYRIHGEKKDLLTTASLIGIESSGEKNMTAKPSASTKAGKTSKSPVLAPEIAKQTSATNPGKKVDSMIAHSKTSPSMDIGKDSGDDVSSMQSNTVILGMPDDRNWLRDKEVLLRQNIEIFCINNSNDATSSSRPRFPDDPSSSSSSSSANHNNTIVGFRCLHCSKRKACKGMSDRSAFFLPSKIEKIREAAIKFSHHLSLCPNAPDTCREAFQEPLNCFGIDLFNDYYVRSARDIGLYDSRMGISTMTMIMEPTTHTGTTCTTGRHPSSSSSSSSPHNEQSLVNHSNHNHHGPSSEPRVEFPPQPVDVGGGDFNPPHQHQHQHHFNPAAPSPPPPPPPTPSSGPKRGGIQHDNSSSMNDVSTSSLPHSPLFKRRRTTTNNHPASVNININTENDFSCPPSQPYQI